ncbi:MAG: hypothetical protein RIE08_15335 [Acidimicrobiales bacterium]
MDPDVTEDSYQPPEISDIETADDSEFAVTPGNNGSQIPRN